ncbi:MAG: DUF6273 domain-containing protein, partial [Dethiobacteria bacterium]|nr:DUF6273 domain-containing protein [Dethiobacteria bacterium]
EVLNKMKRLYELLFKAQNQGRKKNSSLAADEALQVELNFNYEIDYESGTTPLGDLPIGALVVDPTWEWEFRTSGGYTGNGEMKPVTWVIVAHNHYEMLEPHTTLLSQELIGKYYFDNSINRGHNDQFGNNHWGDSGAVNAACGIWPWLNSTGIHSGEGFCRAISGRFKEAMLTTTLPNKEWEKGDSYKTKDKVFLPSSTELGDSSYDYRIRQIGATFSYFKDAINAKRSAVINGQPCYYWTRSPRSGYIGRAGMCIVSYAGDFAFDYARHADCGVRPALNLKSDTLVTRGQEKA